MTYPVWPTLLPRPERPTWSSTPQEARVKRQNDAGPPGWRRRFSSAATMVSLSVLLTRNQRAAFDQFYQVDCKRGSQLFWMPDPTTDGWPMMTADGALLLDGMGQPLLMSGTWLCVFGDQVPVESIQGTEFRKTFNIAVMP